MDKHDWHPADIIAGLRKKGTTLAAVSRASGLASSTLANALTRHWPKGERLSEVARTDETNLLYVATTRARKLLVRNELLKLLCEQEEPDDIAEELLTCKGE
ncbi:helix-turn-helix domain-containing protein [Pectobacterium versatile]|uniref:Regulator n=1 Tax=Pectobacterium versatile TaxID=2488639 RepID=A0A855M8P5_9GAMM|nr:regulator [Pectobacterium versatile]